MGEKTWKKDAIIANIMLIIVLTTIFVIMGYQKQISFCDEMFTYDTANSDMPVNMSIFNTEEWITGEQVKNFFSASEVSLFQYKQISYHLYKDHVPLYFWLFRTVSVLFFKGSCSKWIGLICNYPFYIAFGVFLNYFFNKRFGAFLSFLGTLLVMLHPCMIAQLTMIRMYQMFTTIIVIFMLYIKEDYLINIKYCIIMGLVLATGLLTHYHFWIYVIVFSAFFGLTLLFKKKYKQVFYYIQICIIGIGVTTIFYPSWRIFLFSGKGETAINNLLNFKGFVDDIKAGIWSIVSCIFGEEYMMIGGVILCGLLLIYLYFNRLQTTEFYVITGATVLYICVVAHSVGATGTNVVERYLWPAISVLLVGIAYLLCAICQYGQRYFSGLKGKICCVYGCGLILGLFAIRNIHTYLDPMKISYLKSRTEEEAAQILELANVPWLVFADDIGSLYHGAYDFTYASEIRRVPLDALPYYDEKMDASEKIVVFTMDDYKNIDSCIEYLEASINHSYTRSKKVGLSGAFSVYVVE